MPDYVIHGRNLKIYNSGGTALIAAAKSCTIRKQCDTIEVSSSSDGTVKNFLAGRTSWTVEISHLLMSSAPQGGIPLVGTTYAISVKDATGSTPAVVLTGNVVCTEATILATVGNLATGSVKMQGTGPLAVPSS